MTIILLTGNKIRNLIFISLLMFATQACTRGQVAKPIENKENLVSQQNKTEIRQDQAVDLAKREALKKFDSLEEFNLVTCETARTWIIIYDNGGPEYILHKKSGLILSSENRFQASDSELDNKNEPSGKHISEQEAREIAKREGRKDFGEATARYDAFPCELANVWTVLFEYREVPGELLPNSRSPYYSINKQTGQVIRKGG